MQKHGGLEIFTLSEVRERETSYDITHMQNLKKIQMNLFTKQTDSQTQQTNLRLLVGTGRRIENLGLTCTHCYI